MRTRCPIIVPFDVSRLTVAPRGRPRSAAMFVQIPKEWAPVSINPRTWIFSSSTTSARNRFWSIAWSKTLSAEAPKKGSPTARRPADGKGAPYTVDYYGTGFLVERGGLVLTNRHVAEPWWNDAAAQAFQAQGFQPRFVRLRAFFPHQGAGVRADRGTGLGGRRPRADAGGAGRPAYSGAAPRDGARPRRGRTARGGRRLSHRPRSDPGQGGVGGGARRSSSPTARTPTA